MGRVHFILLLAATSLVGAVWAQSPGSESAQAQSPPPHPPPPLPVSSPVDFFRQILAMNPAQRQNLLTNRSDRVREFLATKIQEFEVLSPPVREARLQTLQLRWYMLPLMKVPAAQRTVRLASMPETDRRLVEDRLEQWDLLPADLQKKVLENENVIRLFFRSETNASATLFPASLTGIQRVQLEADRARWNTLPDEERAKIQAQFERFFELNAREKTKILEVMKEDERQQMEQALRAYARLPAPQREICLKNFQRFASLSVQERREFLVNAQRWQTMSPEDRQLWRDLVRRIRPQPPLPPGLRPKQPPLPPGAVPRPPDRLPASSDELSQKPRRANPSRFVAAGAGSHGKRRRSQPRLQNSGSRAV